MKLLVSVRCVEEARVAADGGADFIDLKEPGAGALGGLPIATIREIVEVRRRLGCALPISATIGDVPMCELARIMARVDAVGACGVDYVKVGVERDPMALAVLDALACSGRAIVPVFIADRGFEAGHVAHACELGFPGVMADTADKLAGNLFDTMPIDALRHFIATVRAAGALVGLAGALRLEHHPQLCALAPDFVGFRSAVCAGDRSAALDPLRLRALCARMRERPDSADESRFATQQHRAHAPELVVMHKVDRKCGAFGQ